MLYEGDSERLAQIVRAVRAAIDQLHWDNGFATVRMLNGSAILHLAGVGNRPRDYPDQLRNIFDTVAAEAPGSYGVRYERDDERTDNPGPNEFTVTVMRRGEYRSEKDPFFSPIRPIIED